MGLHTADHNRFAPFFTFVAVGVVCAAVLAGLFWPLGQWAHYPLVYEGDGLWNLFLIKTVLQTGWYGTNPFLGAPFSATFLDFAKPETVYLLLFHISGWFTDNVVLLHNLFYFLGFFMVAGSALIVLRTGFLLSWWLAGSGALLYTFLPFHFTRMAHLFLSNYFVVPLAVWLVLQVSSSRLPFFEFGRFGVGRWQVWLAAVLLASTSIYYAFFGLCLIFTASLLSSIRTGAVRVLMSGSLVCLLTGSLVVANLAPSLLYKMREGPNQESAVRTVGESEIFALRPVQLLLPSESHRIRVFAELTQRYEAAIPFVNESRLATLGLLGSAGFLLLLLALLTGHRSMDSMPQFAVAARVNAMALILSVAGGGGAILGLLVSPQFRALNRISVVIAFVSVAAVLMVVERGLFRWSERWQRVMMPLVALLLVTAGLWDQIPLHVKPDPAQYVAEFESDRAFVRDIEKMLPINGRVLQMPYTAFPETPPVYKESVYSHLRGFLHSKSLRWSYGGMKGREADLWHRALEQLPLSEQVSIARESGFNGIWLDRRAMQDAGRKIDEGFRVLGMTAALESMDRMLVFYPISSAANVPPPLLAPPLLGDGFYGWEESGEARWAWSRGNASFWLMGSGGPAQRVRLSITLHSLIARSVSIVVGQNYAANLALPSAEQKTIDLEFLLPLGRTTVRLMTDMPAVVPGGGDNRPLAFAVSSVKFTVLKNNDSSPP